MDNMSCIIPCAGPGRRMRSYGPKALVQLNNGLTVIGKQLYIINKLYPKTEIVVIVGFEAEKICKELPDNIKIVENTDYENTNVAYSLKLGLKAVAHKKVLIIYGDLVFNEATLQGLALTESTVIVDKHDRFNKNEVGVTIVDGFVSRFSYGLPTKWAQIAYLSKHETEILKRVVNHKNRHKLFGFELLNHVIDAGGFLKATQPKQMQIAEIDTSRDIEAAKRII